MSSRLRTRLRAGTGLSTPSLNLEFQTAAGTLDPRITFSRTSQATLVDSTGKLTYAPNNLLTNSEDFESAAWAKQQTTVTADAAIAPNNTLSADKVIDTAVTNFHVVQQNQTTTGSSIVVSIFAKAAERTQIHIRNGNAGISSIFDLSGGTVVSQGAGMVATITNVGSGWYRCSVQFISASGTQQVLIGPAVSGSINYLGDGTSGVFIWGAQLEQVTYQTTPGTYNSTSPKNLLGYTQEFDNAAWIKSNAFVQTNLLTYSEAFDNAAWSKGAATITANADIAPNGTSTADAFVELAINTAHSAQQSVSFVSGIQYTLSLYIKAGLRTWAQVLLPSAAFTSQQGGYFDLTGAGALGTTNGTPTSRTITAVGGGWYRVTITATATATATDNILIRASTNGSTVTYLGSAASPALYLWGAQLVQGSTAGDYQRTDAAAAAVQYVAPDGSRTADKLVPASSGAARSLYATFLASGSSNTASIYLKAGEKSIAGFVDYPGNLGAAWFNLLTGEVTNVLAGYTASMQSVGGGWYRCSITATPTSGTRYVQIFVSDTAGSLNVTGDGTSGIYLWGAQLSNSASLDPYVYNPVAAPTSAAYYGPRFDYDPVTLANKGLLIEEQRTNLITYSQEFDNAAWVKGQATITANAIASPDGTTNADMVTQTAISPVVFQSFSISATPYTAMVRFKQGTAPAFELQFGTASFAFGVKITYTFATNAASVTLAGSPTGVATSVLPIGNGWYEAKITVTATAALWYFDVHPVGSNGQTVYVWGAQLEAGSFATSYIPTVASQVTRTADVALMQGANFSNWYNQNEGTFVTSADAISTGANRVIIGGGSLVYPAYVRSNGQGASFDGANLAATANLITTDVFKLATTYGNSEQQACLNGGAVANGLYNNAFASLISIGIGSAASGAFLNGHIRRIGYYPTRLANAQLQSLTAQSTIPSLSLDFTTQVFNVG